MQVQSVRFTYLCYFVPQLRDSFFDGILHDDRLAPHAGRITDKELAFTPTLSFRREASASRISLSSPQSSPIAESTVAGLK
jgi:hypothetical protein